MRCIDIHTHLGTPGSVPSPGEMATMMRLAKRQGIERVVALGNLGSDGPTPTQDQIRAINDNTLAAMRAHPAFFAGFCYLNPAHDAAFSLGEIERCVVRGGMRGLKFWIAVRATDRCHDPLMDRARELGIPILYHAWYKQTDQGAGESTPAEIADLARRFPQVTIVMAHLTGDGERGVLDILECPNVLIDTSGGQPESGLVEYAVRRLDAERVIYGSDWPIRDFAVQVARVVDARLTGAQREQVLFRNAQRILGSA
ncbi:MAG: amidohydrolase family protein [Planctomycetota bacterium]|nr:amidohydrolase family protein [Planctomycetota bacterium]